MRHDLQRASGDADKKAIAEETQRRALQVVTHVPLGEWYGVGAVRANIQTREVPPPVTVFWGMSKK